MAVRTPVRRPVAVAVTVTLAVLALGALSGSGPARAATSSRPLTGSITVSAAASLTTVFTTLAAQFQALHHATTIALNFGSSAALATQIEQGAPADVFASAAQSDMAALQRAGDITGAATTFTRNSLEIVVKPGNPRGIHSLAGLRRARVVALCASSAPCGKTAREALFNAGVRLPASRVTLGIDVSATLAQVTAGDADAAIVYVTNARSLGHLGVGVKIPPSQNVTTSYPIGLVAASRNRALARAWIAYVLGPAGQRALRTAGFLAAR